MNVWHTFSIWHKNWICDIAEKINFYEEVNRKNFHPFLEKIKQHKEQIKKIMYSTYKEDFAFSEQEEKEGGFWGCV